MKRYLPKNQRVDTVLDTSGYKTKPKLTVSVGSVIIEHKSQEHLKKDKKLKKLHLCHDSLKCRY